MQVTGFTNRVEELLNPLTRLSSIQNYTEKELKEFITKISNANECLKNGLNKRKLSDDHSVTCEETSKRQKTDAFLIEDQNELFKFLPALQKIPVTESSTIVLHQKNESPLHYNIPRESLICSSKIYKKIFEDNNQMSDMRSQLLEWNDPQTGPFYSVMAVEHFLTFAYALSRNFRSDIVYHPLKEYEDDQIDEMLEDLLTLIHYYAIDEKLEEECAECIVNKIVEGKEIAETFLLAYRYPLKKVQQSWLLAVVTKEEKMKVSILEQLMDLLESDEIKQRGLIHTYPILKDTLIKLFQPLYKKSETEELKLILNENFLERFYKNLVKLFHLLPESLLPGTFNTLDILPEDLETPFAWIWISLWDMDQKSKYSYENEYEKTALKDLNSILAEDPKNSYALTNRGILFTKNKKNKKQEALNDFNQALELNPEDLRALVSRSEIYESLGEFQLGLKDITSANELCPENYYILSQRGSIYFHLKEYKLALTDFDLANKINSSKIPKYLFLRAYTCYHLGFYEQALSDLNEYINIVDTIKTPTYRLRGLIHQKLGKKKEALKDFSDELNELNSFDLESLFHHASLVLESEWDNWNLGKAAANIKTYLEKNEDNPEAFALQGKIYYKMKMFEGAWTALKTAYDLNQRDEGTLTLLGIVSCQIKKFPFAYFILKKALEINPNNASAQYFCGEVLFHLGQLKEGLQLIETSLSLNPQNVEALTRAGKIHYLLGNRAEALKKFNLSLEKTEKYDPKKQLVNFYKLKISFEEEKTDTKKLNQIYEELKTVFNEIKADENLKSDCCTLFGEIFLQLNRMDEALKQLNLAINHNIENQKAFLLRGQLNEKLGKQEEAVSDFTMVLLYDPKHVLARYQRALLYYQLQKTQLAFDDLKQVLQLDPDNKIVELIK